MKILNETLEYIYLINYQLYFQRKMLNTLYFIMNYSDWGWINIIRFDGWCASVVQQGLEFEPHSWEFLFKSSLSRYFKKFAPNYGGMKR